MQHIEQYQKPFLKYLERFTVEREPKNLYSPINYILELGGKRLRPILTLMTAEVFGERAEKAMDAALSIEIFHNFSLVHDDIMDDAPLRRGQQTVHEKWNLNTGILSGDAMLILAYQLFENYDAVTFQDLAKLFSKTALEVCEGQQHDFDFESTFDVSVSEYLKMITQKTAVLVAASLKFGAIIADANKEDSENIYNYGLNLGIAFQLQDDYLDVYGKEDFGKQKAGDIIENKKTFLFLKALELAEKAEKVKLLNLYSSKKYSESKIENVITLFNTYNIPAVIESEIEKYTIKAVNCVHSLSVSKSKKSTLEGFAKLLMGRKI